ncbi:TraB/GumN family protein [Brevundimonas sp.]|uniref:TraB/GumN family protein n=1 Tax=Brevundimonas sp. TaxID=1871086 RepID=UPI001A349ED6|nr:TraB/GumN family protein [Brevundimonas sp.]MBJ7486001.1 TraB/GumN family protein [Brevundimonas sp.]
MTTLARLKTSVADLGRFAGGSILGLALAAALVAAPARALAQAAPATAAAAPAAVLPATGSGPALWVVKDADSTLYLFGTVHVLRPTTAWGSAKVDAAFAASSDVYFEISNPDDQAAILPLIQQYGISPQTPLSSLLTPVEIADLDAAAKTMGASAAQLDPLRPWMAGLTLSIAPLIKAGYDPASGVETILKARALAGGKSVRGFETLDEQVRVLATLPEDAQLQFLRSTLESFDAATTELDGLVAAWAAGDVAGIQALGVDEMKATAPAIYDALLTRRNAGFADDIQGLLAGSGTAFIAVGAAHLAGPDSVQAMLETRGVDVEQQ